MYGETLDFQCQYQQINDNIKYPIGKSVFAVNLPLKLPLLMPWGYLVQRSIRRSAAEMGRKISLDWYTDDPLFSAKTGIIMGHIFKMF